MKTTMAVERANLQDPAPAALARRHRSCWIHVSFGVAPVLSLPQNGANDPQRTFQPISSPVAQSWVNGFAVCQPTGRRSEQAAGRCSGWFDVYASAKDSTGISSRSVYSTHPHSHRHDHGRTMLDWVLAFVTRPHSGQITSNGTRPHVGRPDGFSPGYLASVNSS